MGKERFFLPEREGRRYFYASGQQENNSKHDNHGRIPEKETSDKKTGRYRKDRPLTGSGRPEACRDVICVNLCSGHDRDRCHGSPEKPGCGRRVHKGKNKGADIHAGK